MSIILELNMAIVLCSSILRISNLIVSICSLQICTKLFLHGIFAICSNLLLQITCCKILELVLINYSLMALRAFPLALALYASSLHLYRSGISTFLYNCRCILINWFDESHHACLTIGVISSIEQRWSSDRHSFFSAH